MRKRMTPEEVKAAADRAEQRAGGVAVSKPRRPEYEHEQPRVSIRMRPWELLPDERRCMAITKAGTRCRNAREYPNAPLAHPFCSIHRMTLYPSD